MRLSTYVLDVDEDVLEAPLTYRMSSLLIGRMRTSFTTDSYKAI